MIMYFSGSGNCRYAAQIIAEVTGDEVLSINERIKAECTEMVRSSTPFVFVCPVYAGRLPRVVEKHIRETQFEGCKKVYFVSTCYQTPHNMVKYIRKLCKEKGFDYYGFEAVNMPQNYIIMYTPPQKAEAKKIIRQATPEFKTIAETIKNGQLLTEKLHSVRFGGRVMSDFVNLIFYPLAINAKGFNATDVCVGCGECSVRCPMNNIKIIDKKPQWSNDCTHCMACIGGCPKAAIEFKKKTQGKPRYYLEK